jgi:hypothetical protein
MDHILFEFMAALLADEKTGLVNLHKNRQHQSYAHRNHDRDAKRIDCDSCCKSEKKYESRSKDQNDDEQQTPRTPTQTTSASS